jgi:AcrR family transcriptional regulator
MTDSDSLSPCVGETKAQTRGEAQRARILAAAEKCFVDRGFHAASMATIAETAQMSPGLIYRYFSSKSEIILAIIDQQLEMVRNEMRQFDGTKDPAQDLSEYFGKNQCPNGKHLNAALFLEMSAEASRDPAIAESIHASDKALRKEFSEWLGRSRDENGLGLPPSQTKEIALMVQLIADGLKVREQREPDLDRDLLERTLKTFMPRILTDRD